MISTATVCKQQQPLVPQHREFQRHSWPDKVTVDISLLLKSKDEGAVESPSTIVNTTSPSSPVSLYESSSAHYHSSSNGVLPPRSATAAPSFHKTVSSSSPSSLSSSTIPLKRSMKALENSSEPPAKRQSKWSPEEDAKIIQLRGDGMKWEDISKHLPGRSAISCRLHYQNYLERRSEWDEDRKNKLARLYERFKADMWAKIAEEMAIPWRAAEAMHWQMGENEMASRAGVTPFSITTFHTNANNTNNNNNHHHHHHHHHSHQPHQHHPHSAGGRPPHYRSNSATSSLRPGLTPQIITIPPQLPSLAELTAGLPAYSPHGQQHPNTTARPQSLHGPPGPPSLYPSPVSLPAPTHSMSQPDPLQHLSQQKPTLHFPIKP